MKKTLIDLFSGCGGLSLGLEQAGFEIVFANDINPKCAKTFLNNIKTEENRFFIGDINDLIDNIQKYKKFFGDVDLLSGGPPCQGFSMANRQRVISDPRNILYKSYLRFLSIVKPKFFIMENVKGMASKKTEIIEDFNDVLKHEYNIALKILNAKDYGIPQNRERLFIIGNRIGAESETIFHNISKREYKPFVLRDAISDLPPLGIKKVKNNTSIENSEVGFSKTEYVYTKTPFREFINDGREIDFLYNHKNRYNNERDIKIFSLLPQGENSLHHSIAEIMPYKNRNHIFKDKYFKLKYDEICKTITSHIKFDCNMYIHPTQPRGLSPREAARVQTFPDDFVFAGPQNSWYFQIGNAVPVKLAKIIGGEILKWL